MPKACWRLPSCSLLLLGWNANIFDLLGCPDLSLVPQVTSSPTPFPYLLSSGHTDLLSCLQEISFHLQELCCMEGSTSSLFSTWSWYCSLSQLKSQPLERSFPYPDKLNTGTPPQPPQPPPPHHSLAHEVPAFSCSFSVYSTESLPNAPLSSQGLAYSKCSIKIVEWVKEWVVNFLNLAERRKILFSSTEVNTHLSYWNIMMFWEPKKGYLNSRYCFRQSFRITNKFFKEFTWFLD